MYEEKPRGFIEELQALDHDAKKKVLVISTIVVMVVVMSVWSLYFNNIVNSASQSVVLNVSSTASNGGVPANGPSIWQNIETGVSSIGNIFNGHSDYKIQPQSN